MHDQGHQLPHIHPGAWLSGVYYVKIPEVIRGDDEDRVGWIEFGEPPADMVAPTEHPLWLEQPVEGRMFLFPSYFYHRTVPFSSDEKRISIAFDVLKA